MGDFNIPGQPFVIHLPDGWTISCNETYHVYVAESPQGTIRASYYIRPENNLGDAIWAIKGVSGSAYYSNIWYFGFPLNGMDCVVMMPIIAILVEYQDVILQLMIDKHTDHSEYSDPMLLLMSGIFPAIITVFEGQVNLPPVNETNPFKLQDDLSKAKIAEGKSFTKVSHTGKVLSVETPRIGAIGKIPATIRHSEKLVRYIEQLKEIIGALKTDDKYADYRAELIKIYRILLDTLNPIEPQRR